MVDRKGGSPGTAHNGNTPQSIKFDTAWLGLDCLSILQYFPPPIPTGTGTAGNKRKRREWVLPLVDRGRGSGRSPLQQALQFDSLSSLTINRWRGSVCGIPSGQVVALNSNLVWTLGNPWSRLIVKSYGVLRSVDGQLSLRFLLDELTFVANLVVKELDRVTGGTICARIV